MNNYKAVPGRNSNQPLRALPATLRAGFILLAVGLIPCNTMAQELPDAGRVLQDNLPSPPLQPVKPSVDFQPKGQALGETPTGGPQIQLNKITLTGNTIYSSEILLAVVGEALGQSYDLAGLRQLANRISRYYRDNGYPFARAYIPEQGMADGALTIDVIEGRYGAVKATGEETLIAGAQGFLEPLEPGRVIESASLERATLILADQPGGSIVPVMRPGAKTGTGDLDVRVDPAPRITGELSGDNHGNRYSGEYRAQADLRLNRAITFGDEISLIALYSNEDLWLGQLAYELPLGSSGLRGRVSYAHTDYTLRAPYEGYTGTAKVSAAGLSYPLLRSRNSNLIAAAGYQYKDLGNELLDSSYDDKSSHSWPLGLQFDHRHTLALGDGITYGTMSATPGHLDADNDGAIHGGFTKANLQLARIQNLPAGLTLLATVSGQWADRELDSSESFTLGGPYGVRAYPQGEAAGSKGWLGQVELGYPMDAFTPYLCYDAGHISRDAEDNRRRLAGGGIGLRYLHQHWILDTVAAWKTAGGDATSDDKQRDPHIWFTAGYRF